MKEFKRFDMNLPPKRMKWYLKPIANLIASAPIKRHKPEVTYDEYTKNIDGPCIILGNHNAFLDIQTAFHLLKNYNANYIVAIDGYIGREWLLRNVGCICKRKFTHDTILIKQIKKVLDKGDKCVIYPEARYSLCGTTAVLPESLGKLIKFYKVPVATIICHGHHINSPFWDTSHERGVSPTKVEFLKLFSKEDIEKYSIDEINQKIVERFEYDDFKWQKDNKVSIKDPKRADGLDKVLYKCVECGTEYEMESDGDILRCTHCHKEWKMTEYGELEALKGKTKFTHIPAWYEWQRECVRKEIEDGTYSTGELPVTIESLPNAKKFINIGEGILVHDMNGFNCRINDKSLSDTTEIVIDPKTQYSVHVEYRYLFKHGDCVDLNTLKDTWYIYPHGSKFNVTKMALATEELYFYYKKKNGLEVKKGLA